MAKVRLLVSDVDGTLVRHDKSLGEATVAAAKRLEAAGIAMTLISARPPAGILPLAKQMGLTLPLGAYNGGTLIKPDGSTIAIHTLAPDLAADLLKLVDEGGAEPWVFADGRWHARNDTNPHTPRERMSAGQDPVIVQDFTPLLDRVDKMVAVSDDVPLLAGVADRAKALAGGRATVALSQPYFLDMTAPVANKGDGLVALAEAAGVPLDEVAVIGDMPNDLPMFARAGLAIAMGQAPDAVKAKAAEISRSNDEDGVAWAIDNLLLQHAGTAAA